jgi:TIR domain
MAEIFISYARADRPRAETLAGALAAEGWEVWWDREIPPGKAFDQVIEDALNEAKCVVVLWSRESVLSEWVKTEAAEAARRRILVPVLGDNVRIPLEFRRIQAAVLSNWESLPANPEWAQFGRAVAALVGRPSTIPAGVITARQLTRTFRPLYGGAGAAVMLLLLLAGTFYRSGQERGEPPDNPSDVVSIPSVPKPGEQPPAPEERPPASGNSKVPVTLEASRHEVSDSMRVPASAVAKGTAAADSTIDRKPLGPSIDKPLAPREVESPADAVTTIAATEGSKEETHPPAATPGVEFDVTHTYGVFRDQAGRMSISAAGISFQDTSAVSSGRAGFDASCADVKKVAAMNVIADRDQRMVELALRDRSYRFKAAHTSARDGILAALSRVCGQR